MNTLQTKALAVLLTACLAILIGTEARAQTPTLVRDFHAGSTAVGNADPQGFAKVGNNVFFTAETQALGRELYMIPGGNTLPVLVTDIVPGPGSEEFGSLAAFNGQVYFGHGSKLWTSDGTAPGTQAVAQLDGRAYGFQESGGQLYFMTVPGTLYISDGTQSGTRPLNPPQTWVSQFVSVGGSSIFFLAAPSGGSAQEVWFYDGTAPPRIADSRIQGPAWIRRLGQRVMVFATSKEVWVSDATTAGTYTIPQPPGLLSYPGAAFGTSFLYFRTQVYPNVDLMITDGTTQAPRVLGTTSGANPNMRSVETGGRAFLTSGWSGLWVTDGTAAGTAKLFEGRVLELAKLRPGEVLFEGTHPATGTELWFSDGTQAGTRLAREFQPGASGTRISDLLHVAPGIVVGGAIDPRFGNEVFVSDGSAAGTRILGDIQPSVRVPLSSEPFMQHEELGLTVLTTSHPRVSAYLSDGTATNTFKIRDDALSLEVASLGGELYVLLEDSELELARVGPAGSSQIYRGPRPIVRSPLKRIGSRLMFAAQDLWSSDGTPQGTNKVLDHNGQPIPCVWRGFHIGTRILFHKSRISEQLFLADSSGDVVPLPFAGAPHSSAILGDRTVLSLSTRGGYHLLISDGTASGTSRIGASLDLRGLFPVALNGLIYFFGSVAGRDGELWRTDGTDTGTQRVADINPGIASSNPIPLGVVDGKLVFLATAPNSGREFWVSDGTPAGTRILKDIAPGAMSQAFSSLQTYATVGGRFYFAALDPVHGVELWESDGTPVGTRLVSDLSPGIESSSPDSLLLVDGKLVFAAHRPDVGREFFALEVGAHTQPIGYGCGIGSVPHLESTVPSLGTTWTLDLAHSPGASRRGVLLVGDHAVRPTQIATGCTVYVDLTSPSLAIPLALDAQGNARVVRAIPNNAALHGLGLSAQAGVDSSQGPIGLDLSPGMRIELRR